MEPAGMSPIDIDIITREGHRCREEDLGIKVDTQPKDNCPISNNLLISTRVWVGPLWVRPTVELALASQSVTFLTLATSCFLCSAISTSSTTFQFTMDGMDMGSSTSSSSGSMSTSMTMTFKNSHNTPLFSNAWTPSSSGAFAGTCIFLIVLAVIDRCLIAFKAVMERHWLAAHL